MSQPIEELIDKWDVVAEVLDTDPMRPIRYAMALRYIKSLDRNSKILEVGCGNGKGLEIIHNAGFENLYGVEVSPDRIKKAESYLPPGIQLKLISPDDNLPFPDGSFDIVISCAVIEHAINPLSYMQEINRILRKGGVCVITSDCYAWRVLQLMGLYKSVQPIDRTYAYNTFKSIFLKSGFELVQFETANMPQRGNVISFHLKKVFLMYLRILISSVKEVTNIFTAAEMENYKLVPAILSSGVKRSRFFNLKHRLLNYINDENFFYLRKK